MAKDKKSERVSEAVWDAVRRDRRARRKLNSKADLQQSAALLRAHADTLDALAANAPEAEPAQGAPAASSAKGEKKKRSRAAKKAAKPSE